MTDVEQVRIELKYTPRAWQHECHKNKRRFTALAVHRRAGKTELALVELLDAAAQCRHELGLFFYVAPQLKHSYTASRIRRFLRSVRTSRDSEEM